MDYNLQSRSAPTFSSYSYSNNINLSQQAQFNILDRDQPIFDDVHAGYNPTLGELRGMSYKFVVNTQMNADKGVKLYDKQAVEALPKEFAQLDDINTFKPIMPNFMKREECRKKIL